VRVFRDYEGRAVRLTDERHRHMLEHPEMAAVDAEIGHALAGPDSVVEIGERSGDSVVLSVLGVYTCRSEAFVHRREGSSSRCFRHHGVLDGQGEEGAYDMADRRLKIWYDREGDYLEVMFEDRAGYFRETTNDQVMEKVDDQGHVIGFSILKVSAAQSSPLEVALSQ
jgi:hypothetical protein